MLLESIAMSWDNVKANRLRSFLTMLGIIIGVASIITLISIVQGAALSISRQIKEFGVNKITVNASGTLLKRGLSEEELAVISQLDNVSGISPNISSRTWVALNGKTFGNVSLQGKNEVYFNLDPGIIKAGRAINLLDIQGKNHVALLGSHIVESLYFGINPIGMDIVIKNRTFTVIGTLIPSRGFGLGSYNNAVMIPYTTALRILGTPYITSLDVFLKDSSLADETVLDIKSVLNSVFNYREDAYTIYNMGNLIDTFQSMMSVLSLLLAGIAAISLVVGGIGIMNMMLVSITERTHEIGLRKALGATPSRIQQQFIIESMVLSLFGGMIGLVIGGLFTYIASGIIGIPFSLSIITIILAMTFSLIIGILFGYMPARKASRLNPIDALRSL